MGLLLLLPIFGKLAALYLYAYYTEVLSKVIYLPYLLHHIVCLTFCVRA